MTKGNYPSHVTNNVSTIKPVPPESLIFQHMRTTTNSFEMAVNALPSSLENFEYVVPDNKVCAIYRTNFVLRDGSMQMEDFGAIGGGITNGILITAVDSADAVLVDLTDSVPIATNGEFALLAGIDVGVPTAGDDTLFIRWSLNRAGGPLELHEGEKFRITIQDSLAPVTSFRAMVQGVVYDT